MVQKKLLDISDRNHNERGIAGACPPCANLAPAIRNMMMGSYFFLSSSSQYHAEETRHRGFHKSRPGNASPPADEAEPTDTVGMAVEALRLIRAPNLEAAE